MGGPGLLHCLTNCLLNQFTGPVPTTPADVRSSYMIQVKCLLADDLVAMELTRCSGSDQMEEPGL